MALGSFKRKLSSIIGGLKWKGPFQSKELTSRETATRDVIVTESQKDISWCLFDGQKPQLVDQPVDIGSPWRIRMRIIAADLVHSDIIEDDKQDIASLCGVGLQPRKRSARREVI